MIRKVTWRGRGLLAAALLLLSCAVVEGGSVNLAWDPSGDPNVVGYVVCFGTSPGTYTHSVNVGNATAWTISGLIDGAQYTFAVQAYTGDGLKGEFSNEVSALVIPAAGAQLIAPVPGSTLTGRTAMFEWTGGTQGSTYRLSVGTSPGGIDIFDRDVGSNSSVAVNGLPTNGATLYARLWTLTDGSLVWTDYSYLALGALVRVSTTTVNPGEPVMVSVTGGPGKPTDWVGLYVPGAADSAFLAWSYLNGLTTPPTAGISSTMLRFTAPLVLGTYEFRLFSRSPPDRLAVSDSVTVSRSVNPTGDRSYFYGGLSAVSGNQLYGTAVFGGSPGQGAVFLVNRDQQIVPLHDFLGVDGAFPYSTLTSGSDGNLYGTTQAGGSNGAGTVFRISPSGSLTTLHNFSGENGAYPISGVLHAVDGRLYGVTPYGGAHGHGTVYRIDAAGVHTTLHHFDGLSGGGPVGVPVLIGNGSLYGTTTYGGSASAGTIFRIDPDGVFQIVHEFSGTDGAAPEAALVQASDSALYGTTTSGGSAGQGVIFKIGAPGVFVKLHDFIGSEGSSPRGRLLEALPGTFYGTTSYGGTSGMGTVFRVVAGGQLTIVLHFTGPNGAFPAAGLVLTADGALSGTTVSGGPGNLGVLFRLESPVWDTQPPAAPAGLTLAVINASEINVTWTASTDNVAVTRYRVERCQGVGCSNFVEVATPTGTTYRDTGLSASTSYRYRVRAADAANNLSAYSNSGSTDALRLITFVQANYASPQSPEVEVAVPFLAAQTAGNLNVVIVGWSDSTAHVQSITDTSGNSYSLAAGPTVQTGVATQSIYYAKNIGSSAANGNTVTVTFDRAARYPDIRIAEYSGLDTVNPFEAAAAAKGSSSTSNSGALTTISPNGLLVAANLVQTRVTGPGAEFTQRLITLPNGDILEDRVVAANGSYSATAPISPAGNWIMQLVAFRASTSTPPLPDLTLTTSHAGSFVRGQRGSMYTLTVTNRGAAPSSGYVTVTDTLPAGLAATEIRGTNWNCSVVVLTCTRSDALGPLASYPVITIRVNVSSSAPAALVNTAIVAGGGELNTANNVAIDTTLVSSNLHGKGTHFYGGLVKGPDDQLYGTAAFGGLNGAGTVFRADSDGQAITLYDFTGPDGAAPYSSLTVGGDGNLYGTTQLGGTNNAGTIFRMTPAGSLTTLHHFSGPDGAYPLSGVSIGTDARLHGTAAYGGAHGHGTVYRIDATGTLTTLHDFNGVDGGGPFGTLVQAADGTLYGTTSYGGFASAGTVFKIDAADIFQTVHEFSGPDGTAPEAGLVRGSDAALYGTTTFGGSSDQGTIFKITESGAFVKLHDFAGSNGASPHGRLLEMHTGTLVGVTMYGGTIDQGTIFSLDAGAGLTTIHHFTGGDGAYPVSDIVAASDGTLYGTTTHGGPATSGVVFRFNPAIDVTVAADPSPYQGTTTLTATLTGNGTALAGRPMRFTFGSVLVGSAVTDQSGVAMLPGVSLAGLDIGTYPDIVGAGVADPWILAFGAADLSVTRGSPTLVWPAPAPIVVGSSLDETQLNATADVPGTFVYSPPAGTVLEEGAAQRLSVVFTPTDSVHYAAVSASVSIDVKKVRVTLRSDQTAPQWPRTTITWIATATDATGPLQYKWWVFDGVTWNVERDWAAGNTFAWMPAVANPSYQIGVWVRHSGGSAPEAFTAAPFPIELTMVREVTLAPDRTAPQLPGTTITWTAMATGGALPLEYKWWVFDGITWNVLRDWAAGNTFAWMPAVANPGYQVGVWVRSNGGSAPERFASAPFPIQPIEVTDVTLAADRTAPQPAGTTITWTATATGGAAPLEYKWWIFDGSSTWTVGHEWATSNTFAWVPAVANSGYQVGVWVRSNGGSAPERFASAPFPIQPIEVTDVTLAADRTAPQPAGTTITWTATATGGAAPLEYKWWIFDGSSTWNVGHEWATSNTFAWVPAVANSGYQVGVWVRSNGGSAPEQFASTPFPIHSNTVTEVTLVADQTAPQLSGTAITWTATATGGTVPIEYKWWMFDGSTWHLGRDWAFDSAFSWIPSVANPSYQVGVWARSTGGSAPEAFASMPFPIQPIEVSELTLAADRPAPQPAGTTINWTAIGTGGTAPLEYKWWVFDGIAWNLGRDWATANTFAWTPSDANPGYQVGVWVRSNGGSGPEQFVSAPFPIHSNTATEVTLVADRTEAFSATAIPVAAYGGLIGATTIDDNLLPTPAR